MKIYEEHFFVVLGAIIGIMIFCLGLWVGVHTGKSDRYQEGYAMGRIDQYEKLIDVARGKK